MIEVDITKDIREYEPKIFGLVTLRQIACLGIGLAYSVPLAIIIPVQDITVKIMIGAFLMIPVIVCGWVQVYGMRMERFVLCIIRSQLMCPINRKYKTEYSTAWIEDKNERDRKEKPRKIQQSEEYPARK